MRLRVILLLMSMIAALVFSSAAQAADAPTSITVPDIYLTYGSPVFGYQLDCNMGVWDQGGVTTYTWARDGVAYTEPVQFRTHTVNAGDIDTAVTCLETIENENGRSTHESNPVYPWAPEVLSPPSIMAINGSTVVGDSLFCMSGSWGGAGYSYTYQWNRGGLPAAGVTGPYYTVGPQDVGQDITCTVSLASFYEDATVASAETAAVTGLAPSPTDGGPYISLSNGSAHLGYQLQCLSGQWSGQNYYLQMQWTRDGVAFDTGTSFHTISAEDVGHEIGCRVQWIYGPTESVVATALAPAVDALAPSVYPGQEPYISQSNGSAHHGYQLQCLPGQWAGQSFSYEFQWLRNGAPIVGADTPFLVVTAPDMGQFISCQISLVAGGPTVAYYTTVAVPALFPEATVRPSIIESNGDAVNGYQMQCLTGQWLGQGFSPQFQWLRDGTVIAGEMTPFLVIQPADTGHQITCIVTMVDWMQTPLASEVTDPVLAKLPTPITPPYISQSNGSAHHGYQLQCLSGQWTGQNFEYSFQWLRNGNPIAGEDTPFLVVTREDMGAQITCHVGLVVDGAEITGATTDPVTGLTPVTYEGQDPYISQSNGSAYHGYQLQCLSGQWYGQNFSYTFQWLRNGTPIEGATNPFLVVSADDIEQNLVCRVGLIDLASVEIATKDTPAVEGLAPVIYDGQDPFISQSNGSAYHGYQLQCLPGQWLGQNFSYTFQWLRNGSPIAGETTPFLIVGADDIEKDITCRVGIVDPQSLEIATKDTPAVEGLRPVPYVGLGPVISQSNGSAYHGYQLQCLAGQWTGQNYTYVFEWLREDEVIEGNQTPFLIVSAADMGQRITCRINLTDTEGVVIASAVTAPVTGLVPVPYDEQEPYIDLNNGNSEIGSQLQCMTGQWTGQNYTYEFQWLSDGNPIVGQTSPFYGVAFGVRGTQLSCRVSLVDGDGVVLTARDTPSVVAGTAVLVSPTILEGSDDDPSYGDTLSCTQATWAPTPDSLVISWQSDGQPIDGSDSQHLVTVTDIGKDITCRTDAIYDGAVEFSSLSNVLHVRALRLISGPAISGPSTYGERLTCVHGGWDDPVNTLYSFQTSTEQLAGGDVDAYDTGPFDVNREITCSVIAVVDGVEIARADSFNSVSILEPAPQTLPVVSGDPTIGSTLTCENAEWTGLGTTTTFVYGWYRDGDFVSGGDIFEVQPEDAGHSINCRVTAVDAPAEVTFTFVDSKPVTIAAADVELAGPAPVVEGSLFVGQALTCERGEWTGNDPISFSYAWTADGEAVGGADSTLLLTAAEAGKRIKCYVNAEDRTGQASRESDPVGPVVGPVDPGTPTVTGTTEVGQTLTCNTIEVPAGATLVIEWYADGQLIPSPGGRGGAGDLFGGAGGAGGALIGNGGNGGVGGAALPQYTLVLGKAQLGAMIACRVIFTNGAGPASATSDEVGPVTAPAVAPSGPAPTITGNVQVGSEITCVPGEWSGTAPIELTYEWFVNGELVDGETASELELTAGMESEMVYCRVTGTNAVGEASMDSEPVGPVGPLPTVPTGPDPVVLGSTVVGETLTCYTDPWSNNTPFTLTYSWSAAPLVLKGDADKLTLTEDMVGLFITCHVTATSDGGSATHDSAPVGPVTRPLQPIQPPAPTVVGETHIGQTLTCRTIEAPEGAQLLIQWLVNGQLQEATGATLTLNDSHVGDMISCRVTLTNGAGPASATSAPVGPITGDTPVLSGTVSIVGEGRVGSILTCVPGAWTGDPLLTITWLLDGKLIGGAAGSQITATAEMVDKIVSCRVVGESGNLRAEATSTGIKVLAALTSPIAPVTPKPDPKPDPENIPPMLEPGPCDIIGTPARDKLVGTPKAEVICALSSNDVVYGGGGADIIYAGAGADLVHAGSGSDHVYGSTGGDTLLGEGGKDVLEGGAGSDYLSGGASADRLEGGPGADVARGDGGTDRVTGGVGSDHVSGNSGNDVVTGGWRIDPLPGTTMKNPVAFILKSMKVADGADIVEGGAGADITQGGTGNDRVLAGDGNDRIWGGAGSDRLYGGAGNDTFYRSPGCDRWYGESGSDRELIVPQWARIGCSGVFAGV